MQAQKAFEKGLLEKTAKTHADVILYDNRVVTFKTEGDVMIFVVGSAEENEILLFVDPRGINFVLNFSY